MKDRLKVKIKRQASPKDKAYWEEFEIEYRHGMNVITILQDIQKNPVTAEGKPTSPVVWECNCLEEVCGACTMNINGKVQQACTALVDNLKQPIVLEPMKKFPLVRDLKVDRTKIFDDLKRVQAWVEIDGTHDLGPAPRFPAKKQQFFYQLSRCMSCGCCMEGCPMYNTRSNFMGAAIAGQIVLFNEHPNGKMNAEDRLEAALGEGGIADCGNAQNCDRLCPKELPLVEAIARLGRQTTKHGVFKALDR